MIDPLIGMMDGDNMEYMEDDGEGMYGQGEYHDNPDQPQFMQGYAIGEYGYQPTYYPTSQQQPMHFQMPPRAPGTQMYGYGVPSSYGQPAYYMGMQQDHLGRAGDNSIGGGHDLDDRRPNRGRRKRG